MLSKFTVQQLKKKLEKVILSHKPSFAAVASNADFGMKETFPTTCFLSHIVPL
jgi:hypothetical protein